MAIYSSVFNSGTPIKSSIPLVERKFGLGLGFVAQSSPKGGTKNDEEVLIELSRSALSRGAKLENSQNSSSSYSSASPLSQALDALGDISKRIGSLQDKYLKSAAGSETSNSLASELNSLAKEFKRITDSDLFKPFTENQSSSSSPDPKSLDYRDSRVDAVYASGDETRIKSLHSGLKGLASISFDNILSDRSITSSIQEFINTIKGALSPTALEKENADKSSSASNSVLITAPQVGIRTVGSAEGLSISLLSYSNEDIIKAAAAHVDLEATNVLLLTFNAPEPETEEEKKEREEKADVIEVENPS